jgi:hypothetical protein
VWNCGPGGWRLEGRGVAVAPQKVKLHRRRCSVRGAVSTYSGHVAKGCVQEELRPVWEDPDSPSHGTVCAGCDEVTIFIR